jgi:predicted HicB family RNase H-like nuclease
MQLRLPPDIKAWLAAEAERNGASQNSEVIRALRDRMERTSPAATRDQN